MAAMPELKTAASRRAGFEGHDLVLEDLRVGVREAGIDEVGALAVLGLDLAHGDGEGPLGGFGIGEDVRRAAEDCGTGGTEGKAGMKPRVRTAVRGRTSWCGS